MNSIVNQEYENLIDSLIQDGYLKTLEIIEAFRAVDRINFVSEEYKNEAYINAPLPIGFGQTISQPLTVAFMIELLGPKSGEHILEIGAGSGWQTAILSYLADKDSDKNILEKNDISEAENSVNSEKPAPKVIAIERIPELKEMAEKNVSKYNFIEKGITSVILADGSKGYKPAEFYDKIICGAASSGDVPGEWRKQLKIGGRIVAPVDNSIVVIDKLAKNEYSQKEYFGFSFVPLIKE
ncbi:MAG: protein-L-isoaspartate O-methyltransferase [Patescibacteria group bacterium]